LEKVFNEKADAQGAITVPHDIPAQLTNPGPVNKLTTQNVLDVRMHRLLLSYV